MKRFIFSVFYALMAVASQAQQYAVYATPQGQVKPLPNGQSVIIPAQAGGANGQIQWNNSTVLAGFTMSGDGTLVPSTGVFTIGNQAVTNQKLAQMPGMTFKANNGGGANYPSDLTVTETKGLLAISYSDVSGLGTSAQQNASGVAITGGTIIGTAYSNGVINNSSVIGLPAPVNPNDAARLIDVNNVASGIVQRTGVQVATTANISLTGEQTIDGVLTSTSRIMVKNQTLSQNNGIYVTSGGAWSRASDSNTAGQLKVGYYYFVSSGSTQSSTGWTIQTAPTTLGTDPVVFGQFSASTSYINGTGIGLSGNVFSNSGVISTTGTANEIALSAATGNVTASLPSALTFTGKTVTGGTFNAANFNGPIGAGTPNVGTFSNITNSGIITNTGDHLQVYGFSGNTDQALIYMNLAATRYILGNSSGISLFHGSTLSALFNTAGIQAAIGQTSPFAVTGTVFSSNSNANIRTSKTNFHVTINVKDYGALGDGATNDVAAINSAVAALTNYSALYFPPGNYVCSTAGINALSSLTGVTIYGEGAKITNSSGINNNTLVINPTCDNVVIRDLTFKHTAASRGTGVAIRLYSDNSSISNCLIDGAGEFGVLISNESGGVNDNSSIDNCTIENTMGDGLHIGQVSNTRATNLTIENTGDDAVGIIDDVNQNTTNRIILANINIYNAGSLGTSGCGVRILEATDVLVSNVQIYTSKEAGIYISRSLSTTDYNSRIIVQNCLLSNVASLVGPRGAVWVEFSNLVTIDNVIVESNQNGYGFCFLDCNDLNVKNSNSTGSPSRGFGTDDSTTTNVAATWTRWTFSHNLVDSNAANEAYYFVPASGKAIANLMVLKNDATNAATGNYIFTNRLATAAKVGNNTSLESRAVANGGSGIAPTTFNNN